MPKDSFDNAKAGQFEAFWKASEYSDYTIREFAAAQDLYNARDKSDAILEYPSTPFTLPSPKTTLNQLAKKRSSGRKFNKKPLSRRELGTLLSSFTTYNGLEHRGYASAGASYCLEIFCMANNVEDFSGELLYYNPDLHALSHVAKAPPWTEASQKINVLTEGVPQLVIFFVLVGDRLTGKYLERGGRFALIEAGAAVQQLGLQIAGSKKLVGVAAGGLIDRYWLNALQLDRSQAKIALGYLCGK